MFTLFRCSLPNTLFDAPLDAKSRPEVAPSYPHVDPQNPVVLYIMGSRTPASLLTIYARADWTRHFLAYCFKPVTGLIVSRTWAVATVLLLCLEPGG
jgi:hypothetical protein